MARKPMTDAQKKARAKKAAATREAKKKAALEMLGVPERKKPRKRRVMTAEQKAKAAERLEKARAARGPAQHTMIADNVKALPDDNIFSLKNVRRWIKTNKELLTSMSSFKDSKDSSERLQYATVENYITNLNSYLRTGEYTDLFYGEHRQNKIKYRCTHMAYHADGTPKRTPGVYYSDIGVYTEEMAENDRRKAIPNQNKVRKTSGRVRA